MSSLAPAAPLEALPASLRGMAGLARAPRTGGALLALAAFCVASEVVGFDLVTKGALSFGVLLALSTFEVVTLMTACAAGGVVGWLLPVRTRPTLRHVAGVGLFSLAATLARVAAQYLLSRAIGIPVASFDLYLAFFFPSFFLTTCTFAGLGVGLRGMVRERDLAAAAARMEAELARARMRALSGRIRPRLVLATLRAIARRMETDVDAADQLLVRLGELLRLSLQRVRAEEAKLADRLREVEPLLEPEGARGGRSGPGAAWLAPFWATALLLFAGLALYAGQPVTPVPGGRVVGAALRGATSATFWTAACALAFGAGWAAPGLRRAGMAARCT
ncbi:MAG TPA: hypothetical protein VFQ39_15650, partial [Longimicrobium sp.]|nr:hypothetical protein [Longimicrobium sp.]